MANKGYPFTGRKVIEAFNFGLKNLKINYDVICKFDGDIELPIN